MFLVLSAHAGPVTTRDARPSWRQQKSRYRLHLVETPSQGQVHEIAAFRTVAFHGNGVKYRSLLVESQRAGRQACKFCVEISPDPEQRVAGDLGGLRRLAWLLDGSLTLFGGGYARTVTGKAEPLSAAAFSYFYEGAD